MLARERLLRISTGSSDTDWALTNQIYITYMQFKRIADIGKLSQVRNLSNLGLIFEHITGLAEMQIISIYHQPPEF